MATKLNTYNALHNNEMDGEILQNDTGLSFINFLPRIIQPGDFFLSAVYESFRALFDRANAFLRSNRRWKVISCESVKFKLSDDKVDPVDVTYNAYGKERTHYIRGLRLWLTERKDEMEREQQIGYFNLIPHELEKGGIFKSAKMETLDMVVARFNSQLQVNPLPGRVITMESQITKMPGSSTFDPDTSTWSVRGKSAKTFMIIIRIYYEIMANTTEEIGIQDFIPDKISRGGLVSHPEYERFSLVVNKASTWCAQQRDIRFCNAQTLEIKVKKDKDVDSKNMYYDENEIMPTFYVRVLRVAYTKPLTNRYSVSEKPTPITELTCRTFVPVQLFLDLTKYEDLVVTRERISAWVKATGVRVLSAETVTYRVMTGLEKKQGSEASFSVNMPEESYTWMYVIRLYIDGRYQEPPPEKLPEVPVLRKASCSIS